MVDLDNQEQQRDLLIAQDNVRIRQMQEQREREDLAGLGALYNAWKTNHVVWLGGHVLWVFDGC